MNVLLTGGAGYIGSHIVRALKKAGHKCVVFDNLCKGHPEALGDTILVEADIRDTETLADTMRKYEIEAVINLAAFIEAGESVTDPEKYYQNNTILGFALLNTMRDCGVKTLVFSSTAAVYGTPKHVPIKEDDILAPINPYGASKLCVEYMIESYANAYDIGCVALRYFNVAGADPSGDIGEDHSPESHLIPLILQVAMGKREKIYIFGDDYDTPDGTCIRDYIHVCDLANAHVLALETAERGTKKIFNLGNGNGFSVRDVIETCRKVTGHPIPAELAERRPGDPDSLVASSEKAIEEMKWRPQYPELEDIVTDAWRWHNSHPDGYSS